MGPSPPLRPGKGVTFPMAEDPANLLYALRDRLMALYPDARVSFDLCQPPYIGGFLDTFIQGHTIIYDWLPDRGFGAAHDDTLCWDHSEIWRQDLEGILRYTEEVLAGTWVFPGYGHTKQWDRTCGPTFSRSWRKRL